MWCVGGGTEIWGKCLVHGQREKRGFSFLVEGFVFTFAEAGMVVICG